MRLYAYLLLASVALAVRAATIPVPENEKKLPDVISEDGDKTQQNVSSEREVIDQANTIQDVENQLRVKPDDIPVEVIVEKEEPSLNLKLTDEPDQEEEEINRPTPDLRNPGPPQRQEHETQNPAYYPTEQQDGLYFKQSINQAQTYLRQGIQSVSDSIHNAVETNDQLKLIKKSIQNLRDGFTSQISKLNGTINSHLNPEHPNVVQPASEDFKNNYQNFESSLVSLRNDVIKGLNTLTEGIDVAATSRDQNSSSTVAPATGPWAQMLESLQSLQSSFMSGMQNIQQSFQNINFGFINNNATSGQPLSDAPASSTSPPLFAFGQPGSIGSGTGPIFQTVNRVQQFLSNIGQPAQPAPATQPSKPAVSEPKPSASPSPTESKPQEEADKPQETSQDNKPTIQTAPETPSGPIRQILQNNPISKGIASAVQRLQQNIKSPETPREAEKPEEENAVAAPSESIKVEEKPVTDPENKGHGHGDSGDNLNVSGSRLEEPAEKLPESEKTGEVANKTE